MSRLNRAKTRAVLDALCENCDGETELQRALDALEECVLDDAAVTSKLADPALAWYADQHDAMKATLDAIEAVHRQGGVKAPGYPQGWCTHDHHPWPCPTARIIAEQQLLTN